MRLAGIWVFSMAALFLLLPASEAAAGKTSVTFSGIRFLGVEEEESKIWQQAVVDALAGQERFSWVASDVGKLAGSCQKDTPCYCAKARELGALLSPDHPGYWKKKNLIYGLVWEDGLFSTVRYRPGLGLR